MRLSVDVPIVRRFVSFFSLFLAVPLAGLTVYEYSVSLQPIRPPADPQAIILSLYLRRQTANAEFQEMVVLLMLTLAISAIVYPTQFRRNRFRTQSRYMAVPVVLLVVSLFLFLVSATIGSGLEGVSPFLLKFDGLLLRILFSSGFNPAVADIIAIASMAGVFVSVTLLHYLRHQSIAEGIWSGLLMCSIAVACFEVALFAYIPGTWTETICDIAGRIGLGWLTNEYLALFAFTMIAVASFLLKFWHLLTRNVWNSFEVT